MRLVKIWLACVATTATVAARADALVIIPDKITLNSPAARQQLFVEQVRDRQLIGQVTNALQFTSSDTNVVRIENELAVPVRDGKATIPSGG